MAEGVTCERLALDVGLNHPFSEHAHDEINMGDNTDMCVPVHQEHVLPMIVDQKEYREIFGDSSDEVI